MHAVTPGNGTAGERSHSGYKEFDLQSRASSPLRSDPFFTDRMLHCGRSSSATGVVWNLYPGGRLNETAGTLELRNSCCVPRCEARISSARRYWRAGWETPVEHTGDQRSGFFRLRVEGLSARMDRHSSVDGRAASSLNSILRSRNARRSAVVQNQESAGRHVCIPLPFSCRRCSAITRMPVLRLVLRM